MPRRHVHAGLFDRALRSRDLRVGLEELVATLKTDGVARLQLYRELSEYRSQVDPGESRESPVAYVLD
jgi:hypothetical protein